MELITEDFKVIENKMTEIINILNNNSLKTKKQINTEKNQKIITNSTEKTKANKISSKKNIIKKLINLPEITKKSDNIIEKSLSEENINLYIDLKSDENISQNNDTIQKININNDFNNIKSLILDNLIENKPPNNIINQRKNQFYNLFPDISEEKIVKQEFQDNDINLNIVKGERINLTDLIPNIEISSILSKKKRRIDLPIDYILIQEEKIKKRKGKSIFNENEELPSKRQKKEIKI